MVGEVLLHSNNNSNSNYLLVKDHFYMLNLMKKIPKNKKKELLESKRWMQKKKIKRLENELLVNKIGMQKKKIKILKSELLENKSGM